MKLTDENSFSVEELLSEVQFSPTPEFRETLHIRLKQQISLTNLQSISVSSSRRNGSLPRRTSQNWRLLFASFAVLCLIFIASTILIPTVRAQVISLLQYFEVQLSPIRKSMVASTFTPLVPQQIPSQFPHFNSLNQQDGGPEYVEMRYFNQDSFAVIYETMAEPDISLPQGEVVNIGDYPGSLDHKLNGIVFLAAQAPQPWRALANGGGGGNFDDAVGQPPQQLFYSEAIQLSWIQSGLYIELLTNLPRDDALTLAKSLQPPK